MDIWNSHSIDTPTRMAIPTLYFQTSMYWLLYSVLLEMRDKVGIHRTCWGGRPCGKP